MQEGHVLERRKASSCSILSLFSKREGNSLRNILTFPIYMVSTLSLKEDLSFSHEGPFFLSQRNTEEQSTQRPTETLSQPISQNLTANVSCSSTPNTHHPSPILGSNALWTLYAGGLLWARNVRKNALLTLCALWEIKVPSESHVSHLLERVCSISHRRTQMNRTHKGAQRH